MDTGTPSRGGSQTPVTAVRASAYRIPTDAPEGDGTFEWNPTTLVVPVAALLDHRLHTNQGDGYRNAALPPMREAWRTGLGARCRKPRAARVALCESGESGPSGVARTDAARGTRT
jgi:hypothetical protein